ncbi:MAG: efflux RND transporter periplasmic adaptor subunit [Gemmatimonadota bacterium]|nr:efflux RND transporter periplasmic adaptor subunit [Gemmatimonadota bacterium]
MTIQPWYRRRLLIGGLAAALLLVVVVLTLNNRSSKTQVEKAPTRSTASMNGMDMPSANPSTDGSVVLIAQDAQRFGVTFGTVQMRQLSNEVRTVGTVLVNESRLVKVSPKFSGYVERLYVNFVGQPVRRGQPLAAVFSPDLVAAEQELLVASRMAKSIGGASVPGVPGSSVDLVAAAKQRLRLWDVSEAQINAVLSSGRATRTVTLYAPASGIVLDKKVVQGQAIQAGEELYTIADLSDVWVDAQIREADAGAVSVGTPSTLEFTSYPGRVFAGRLTYVYPVLTEQARTVRARIAVANPGGLLKLGMYATVRLNTTAQSALSVPRSAVVQTGERSLVFVDLGGGKLMPRTVQLGRPGSDYIEIVSGVQAGQRVVTSAQFLIDSESNLGDAMKAMTGMGGSAPPATGTATKEANEINSKGADMRNMPGVSPTPKR